MATQTKNDKSRVRSFLKETLKNVTDQRKSLAAERVFQALSTHIISNKGYVLSFISMSNEISTRLINAHLQDQETLVLPRISGSKLDLYHVRDLENEILRHKSFPLFEPDPSKTKLISPNEISLAIIPALGFDCNGYRIGYGKGYYDRLIPQLKCESYGIGYLEQLVDQPLPIEEHDVPLIHTCLY